MSATLATLGSIGLMLGINEANKLLDDLSLSPAEAEIIAGKIVDAANKRGTDMLRKAQNAIDSVPYLASSQAVQNHLLKARVQANNNLKNVENAVADMNAEANAAANEIREMGSRSFLTKVGQSMVKGKTTTSRAKEKVKNTVNNIDKFANNVNNYSNIGDKYEKEI